MNDDNDVRTMDRIKLEREVIQLRAQVRRLTQGSGTIHTLRAQRHAERSAQRGW